jgi:AmmeMemoRadiSam system protein B
MPTSIAAPSWATALTRTLTLALACAACQTSAEEPFVQPGADDPTARQMTKLGVWYPEDHQQLDDDVIDLLDAVDAPEVRRARAILTPHASLRFSGPTAAAVYARVEIPDRIILIAPDHWGDGEPAAIWTDGPWLIPGHAIEVDHELVAELQTALPDLVPDRVAFEHHEEEMQLPFLQLLAPEVKIAAIALMDNSRNHFRDFDPERIDEWGTAIAGIIQSHAAAGEHVMLLATTDLVHHVELATADEQDPYMMDRVAALDIDGLYDYVTAGEVTICGEIPTSIMMSVVTKLGGTSIEVLALGNSLHANPDEADIIGYPAAVSWME